MSFKWIPAHAIPKYNDIKVCVTFEKNNTKYPVGSLEGKNKGSYERSIIKCPDRTLIVYNQDEHRPLNTSFDLCYDFSMFQNNEFFKSVKSGLICAEFDKDLDRNPFDKPKDHLLIGDSGGFQLRVGKVSYIDPYKIIDWFNRHDFTYGVSVDVVPRNYFTEIIDTEILESLHAHNMCNKIYKNYKRKNLKLMNVIHGFSPSTQEQWAKNVDDKDFSAWAIGSDSGSTIISCNGILMLNEKYKREHYHLFGVGATTNVFYLSWLGKYVKRLTSDTTTYRNSGMAREIQLMYPSGIIRMFHTGKIKEYTQNVATHVPCSCPVCSVVKYIDVYGLDSKYKTEKLLTWHNMLTLNTQAIYWNNLAQNSTYEVYLSSIYDALSNTPGIRNVDKRFQSIKYILEFIEAQVKLGNKEALEKYKKDIDAICNPVSALNDSILDNFAEELIVKENARSLKSKNPNKNYNDFISADCIPNYISLNTIKDKFDFDLSNDLIYLEHLDKVKEDKKKILKEKGTLESYDRVYLRKRPGKILKQLRKQQLKKE